MKNLAKTLFHQQQSLIQSNSMKLTLNQKHIINSAQTMNLFNTPSRQIFFMRRLQNKPVKRQQIQGHSYDEDTYLIALKKFQKLSRGLIPDSPEYTTLRNKVYSELRDEKNQQDELIIVNNSFKRGFKQYQSEMVVADFSSFYCLLVVVPEFTECYETLHILKYFDFPINIDEDNIFRPLIKKEMGFQKEDEYPLLTIDSSSKEMPNIELTTQRQIMNVLQDQGLIGDYRTHSASEQQGIQFLEQEVIPLIEDIYKDFRPLFQFYMNPKHFKKSITNNEPGAFLRGYMWKFYKTLYFYKQNRANRSELTKLEKFAKFQDLMDQFMSRLIGQGHEFHGGQRPDAVDFKLYSWLYKYSHTFTMKQLMLARGKDDKLKNWYTLMDRLCKNKTVI